MGPLAKLIDIWLRAIFTRKSPEVRALIRLWLVVWVAYWASTVLSTIAGYR